MWLMTGVPDQLNKGVPCERQAVEIGPTVPRKTGGAAGRMGNAGRKGAGAVLTASNGRVYPRECASCLSSSPKPLRAILWECYQLKACGVDDSRIQSYGPGAEQPLQTWIFSQA